MKVKREFFFLIIVLMLIALGALNAYAKEDQALLDWCKVVKEKYGGTTITFAVASLPAIDAYNVMTPRFTELTGITVKWDTLNELHLRDKVMMEYASHTGVYDGIMCDCVWLGEFAKKGIVIPVDEFIQNPALTPEWYNFDDFVPAYREGLAKWDGKYYGLVSSGQTNLLAYRKDLFDKYGIDPNSINSYDRLLEVASFFNKKEPDLYGISIRGQRGHHIIVGWFPIMYPFGGRLFDGEGKWNVVINSEKAVKSLDFFIELLKNAPPGVENYSFEEMAAAMARGEVAMAFDASGAPPYYEPEGSVVEGKLGYMPPPVGPEGDFGANYGWLLSISSDSKSQEAAWACMVYMTSPQKVDEFLSAGGGQIGRLSTFEDPEIAQSEPYVNPTFEALKKAYNLIEAGVPHFRPPIPEWSRIGEILGFEANAALIGEKTTKDALDKAAIEIKKIMEESGYYK